MSKTALVTFFFNVLSFSWFEDAIYNIREVEEVGQEGYFADAVDTDDSSVLRQYSVTGGRTLVVRGKERMNATISVCTFCAGGGLGYIIVVHQKILYCRWS